MSRKDRLNRIYQKISEAKYEMELSWHKLIENNTIGDTGSSQLEIYEVKSDRLHAIIPNIEYEDNELELGKQYNVRWVNFNRKYFNSYDGLGRLIPDMFDEFLNDLKIINREIIENDEEYDLYNIELLEKMLEYAKENNYYVYFESY